MNVLRTPDDRFANLSGYAFAPHLLAVILSGKRGDSRASAKNLSAQQRTAST